MAALRPDGCPGAAAGLSLSPPERPLTLADPAASPAEHRENGDNAASHAQANPNPNPNPDPDPDPDPNPNPYPCANPNPNPNPHPNAQAPAASGRGRDARSRALPATTYQGPISPSEIGPETEETDEMQMLHLRMVS